MPIENRNLTKGTKLHGSVPQTELLLRGRGRMQKGRFGIVCRRTEFKSPSAAGMAITGHACDGWVFLECANRGECYCSQCRETGGYSCGRGHSGDRTRNRTYSGYHQDRPQEDWRISSAQPEGCARRSNSLGSAGDCGKSFITSAVEILGICPQSIRPNNIT